MRGPSILLAGVALVATPASGSAQNLVTNSNFDGTLAPWIGYGSTPPDPPASGVASWTSAHNLDNLPGSGSADTTLTGQAAQPANAWFGIRQCIPLPGAPMNVTEASYEASFLARAADNPADGLGNATVEVRFFADLGCTSFIPGAGGSQGVNLTSGSILDDTQWWTLGDPQFLPPGGAITASSAEVRAFIRTVGTTSSGYRVFVDRIVLSLNGTTPVELLGFEVR
jgi:hypothetical protein